MKLKLPARYASALINGDITSSDLDDEDHARIRRVLDSHGSALDVKALGLDFDVYSVQYDMMGEYAFA